MSEDAHPLVRVDSLVRTYDAGGEALDVLRGVNLAVDGASTVAITGESG